MSNEAFDKFLLKLFEKTADKGEISYFNKYEIGKEIGLLNKSEIDRIVKILLGDGFVANNEGSDSNIQITEKGKKRLENNQI
jgi:SOS-response transcriptional repressor LexA